MTVHEAPCTSPPRFEDTGGGDAGRSAGLSAGSHVVQPGGGTGIRKGARSLRLLYIFAILSLNGGSRLSLPGHFATTGEPHQTIPVKL